jgi:hypothetical protein
MRMGTIHRRKSLEDRSHSIKVRILIKSVRLLLKLH